MKKPRRDFLRTISSAAAIPALSSVLKVEVGAGPKESVASAGGELSKNLRTQFPLLKAAVNGHRLTYLDSAATTQRPRAVLDALDGFYMHENANPSKSLHTLARRSATLYDTARAT